MNISTIFVKICNMSLTATYCIAAVILLRIGAGAPDRVVPLAPEPVLLDDDSEVFASRADECFHVRADCPRIEGEAVALKLVTAVEFEKTLCPACGANARVE